MSRIKSCIFALISFAISIVILEGVSYYILKNHFEQFEHAKFNLNTQGNTTMVESFYQVWEHPAYYTSWSGKTHFNNVGFRRFEDISVKKPENTVRIFILGGSASFGSQAAPGSIYLQLSGQGEYSSDETISFHLEHMLAKKYPGKSFEVINAATNWSRLHQQTIRYMNKIRSFEPDLIISMDGQNDSHPVKGLNNWEDTVLGFESKLLASPKHKLRFLFRNSYTVYLMAMLVFRSGSSPMVNEEAIKKYSGIGRPESLDDDLQKYREENRDSLEVSVDDYVQNAKYFHQILEVDEVPHLFYAQPQAMMDLTKPLTEREKAIQGYIYSRIHIQHFRLNFFKMISRQLRDYSFTSGLYFKPMFEVFEGVEGDVYTDYCHFTPYGNAKVAEYFMKDIEGNFPQLLN